MDHYSFVTNDIAEELNVQKSLQKLLGDKYEPAFKYHTSGGFAGLQAGVSGLDEKFYELGGEGVVMVCKPNILRGCGIAVYLMGFDPNNLTYKQWNENLKKMGFKKNKPFSLEELADGIQKEESAEKPSQ